MHGNRQHHRQDKVGDGSRNSLKHYVQYTLRCLLKRHETVKNRVSPALAAVWYTSHGNMKTRRLLLIAAVADCVAVGQEEPSSVQIGGAVKQPLSLTSYDLAKMPRASVKMTSNGLEITYEGVWLHEILKRAGAA